MGLASLVPWPYRLLALALLAAACLCFGWVKGAGHVQSEWDEATRKQVMRVAAVKVKQAEATVQVVTKYVDRVQIVRQKGEDIIKEVTVYVTPKTDSGCIVPIGLVRLRNDAAAGRVTRDSAGSADAGAGATGSDLGGSIGAQ